MAGLFQRMKVIFSAKADQAVDKLEDPRETLDHSYQKQLELLQQVRRGVAEVATSRRRAEVQAGRLNNQIDKLTASAKRALDAGREDQARETLTHKSGLQRQLAELRAQHGALQNEEERLIRASQQLQARVEAVRTRNETIKATYTAAEAQANLSEAFKGLGQELGKVGQAIQQAEGSTARLQARSAAVDALLESAALDDPTGSVADDITLELDALASSAQVDTELAALKASLPGDGEAPGAFHSGGAVFEQPPPPGSASTGENLR